MGYISKFFEIFFNQTETETETPNIDKCVSVYAEFKFKNGEKSKFVDILKGPEGLTLTRNFPGCVQIEYYDNLDEPDTLVIWQKWESREDHVAYLKKREDDGMLKFLEDKLVSPLKPVYMTYDIY
tara:strand:- start:5600 stop:5974 length:375 start_codon:yes stop_codon:yes gene_type:complete